MVFQIPKTPMPLADFHKLKRRLGWRYDYEEGQAFIYPDDIMVDVFLPVGTPIRLPIDFPYRLCSVEDHNMHGLEDLYFEAFRPTVETYALDDADVRADFQLSVVMFATGACGRPMPCSMTILNGDRPIAAALVLGGEKGPMLRTIMVRPDHQRRCLASGLLAEIMERLRREGHDGLHGSFLAANEPARRWCRSTGFIERPDARAIRHFRHFYHYEVARLRACRSSATPALRTAEREHARWEAFAATAEPGT